MKILIVCGGKLTCAHTILKKINVNDYDKIIAVDSGFDHCNLLDIIPDIVVGDFDSVTNLEYKNINNVIKASTRKDDTDLRLAINEAIKLNATVVDIICATGGRVDHLLANFTVLEYLYDLKIESKIIDEQNIIQILTGEKKFNNITKYISIIPITSKIILTGTNLEYPVDNTVITRINPYSISNQATSDYFTLNVKNGLAFIILSND